MKKLIAVAILSACTLAHADDAEYAAKSKAVAEVLLKASLNDPDSLQIDTLTLYRRPGTFANACGTMRAKNAFGGVIRQNFVVSDNVQMPVYIGPIPLAVFKKDCSGEVIESR